MKKTILLKSFCFSLILLISNPIFSNTNNSPNQSIFDVINYQELVEVNLKMNIDAVTSNRKNQEKHAAEFSFQDKNGQQQLWNIKVKLRGKFRRMKCENTPPLKLDFEKKELEAAGLARFDKIKLVTHCVNDDRLAKDLLVKEYLAYKLYNRVTSQSFKVQLVKINYEDTVSGSVTQQYGFLIEPTDQLVARLGAKEIEKAYNFSKDQYNDSQVKVVALFNYLIGNSDYSIQGMRNVKVLLRDGEHILIPFDFDFSGLVNAPYAIVKREHGIKNTRERVFLGFAEDAENLTSSVRLFQKIKGRFVRAIKECNHISNKEKRNMLDYIDSFYEGINYINSPPSVR